MYPVLFSYGRQVIYSYSVVIVLAVLGGLLWLVRQEMEHRDGRLDAALCALATGLLGGRLAHVATNWPYYVERNHEILVLSQGGFSFHAGLLAGLAGLALFARMRRRGAMTAGRRFLGLVGALLPALALGLVGGWLGCLLGGCAYGRVVSPPQRFYAFDWPDLYGVHAFRLPSQLLGLLLALALLAGSRWLAVRPALFFVLYGLGDFLIAFTRGDQSLAWGLLWAVQWADLAVIALGLLLYLADRRWQQAAIRQ